MRHGQMLRMPCLDSPNGAGHCRLPLRQLAKVTGHSNPKWDKDSRWDDPNLTGKQTPPTQNALALPGASTATGAVVGGTSGSVIDYNQDGKIDGADMAIGAMIGAAGGAGAGKLDQRVGFTRGGLPTMRNGAPDGPRNLPMDEASRMARAREMGDEGTDWYHGSNRLDRVVGDGRIHSERATSGPMPYFTDNPELASSYTKKADNSIDDINEMRDYWRTTVNGKEKRLEDAWYNIPRQERAEITDKYFRLGYQDPYNAEGAFVVHPKGVDGSIAARSHLQYLLDRHRGNTLKAMRELWAESGAIFDQEHLMKDLYRKVGVKLPIDDSLAPWTEAPGIMPARLMIKNPLKTGEPAEVEKVYNYLKNTDLADDFDVPQEWGADMWDKRSISTGEWIETLGREVDTSEASYIWTRIPDKITRKLEEMGYDGIIDLGGKGGGDKHRVAIPFKPNQVRSKYAKFDPAQSDSPVLTAGIGGRRRKDVMKDVRSDQFPATRAPTPRNALSMHNADAPVGDGGEGLGLLLGAGAVGGGALIGNQYANRAPQAEAPANALASPGLPALVAQSAQSGLQRREQGLPFPPSVKPDLSSNIEQLNRAAYQQSKRDMQEIYKNLPEGQRLAWNNLRKERAEDLKVSPEEYQAGVADKRLLPNGELQVLINGKWQTLEPVR